MYICYEIPLPDVPSPHPTEGAKSWLWLPGLSVLTVGRSVIIGICPLYHSLPSELLEGRTDANRCIVGCQDICLCWLFPYR